LLTAQAFGFSAANLSLQQGFGAPCAKAQSLPFSGHMGMQLLI